MNRIRVVIADTDLDYIIPLQSRFIEEYGYETELEIITEKEYFDTFFRIPQNIDILVVSEHLYSEQLEMHGIEHTYVLCENFVEKTELSSSNVERIFKYTSVKEVFNQISSSCLRNKDGSADKVKSTKVITICSGKGGLGKTVVSLGIAGYLARNYKKVLYINVAELQNFQAYMDNAQPVMDSQLYAKLSNINSSIYQDIKPILRREQFYYLPPFRSALFSLGLKISMYETIIKSAQESMEYDYIIVDLNGEVNDDFMSFIALADKVVIVTGQMHGDVAATERLAQNIGGIKSDKYLFVCNKYDVRKKNELIESSNTVFSVETYIDFVDGNVELRANEMIGINGISKAAYHIM